MVPRIRMRSILAAASSVILFIHPNSALSQQVVAPGQRSVWTPSDGARADAEERLNSTKSDLRLSQKAVDFVSHFPIGQSAKKALGLASAAAEGFYSALSGVGFAQALRDFGVSTASSSAGAIIGTWVCGPPVCTAAGAIAGSAINDWRASIAAETARLKSEDEQLARNFDDMWKDWNRNSRPKYPQQNFSVTSPARNGLQIERIGRTQVVGLIGGGTSAIGIPSSIAQNHQQIEVRPGGLQEQSAGFESQPLRVIEGDSARHLGTHARYGSIQAPAGAMQSINNADVAEVVAVKEYVVGKTGGVFTFQTLANFVTTEYPEFVGTQYNDTATVTIRTQSGQSATYTARQLFQASVNGSTFTPVTGLPAPLAGENTNDGGGQTGFRNLTARANVAPGSRVTVEFRVQNVGDTRLPSALLLSAPR